MLLTTFITLNKLSEIMLEMRMTIVAWMMGKTAIMRLIKSITSQKSNEKTHLALMIRRKTIISSISLEIRMR